MAASELGWKLGRAGLARLTAAEKVTNSLRAGQHPRESLSLPELVGRETERQGQ